MAQAVGNKAKGRQHSRQQARRAAKRVTRARRQLERKRKRDAKVAARKIAGIPHKESPSDRARRAARLKGYISARIHILRRKLAEEMAAEIRTAVPA
jgi:hypothetical protein